MYENEELEALLSLSQEDEEADAQFVRQLFESEIYFLGEIVDDTLPNDEAQIAVVDWETNTGYHFIPAFTSMRMLEQCVAEDQPYVKVKAIDFLMVTQGNVVSLNPGTSLERVFSPEEIEILMSIFKSE
ncbi:MAG: hypothetical protein EBX40_02140 [Gammaproteobacteria bacterium]|nr:hypothetical protein [Gammaproteobacteria bacterium]